MTDNNLETVNKFMERIKNKIDWNDINLQKDIFCRVIYAIHRGDIDEVKRISQDEREEMFGLIAFVEFIQYSAVNIGLLDEKVVFGKDYGEW